MYGCSDRKDASQCLQERVFPLMMSKNSTDKVSSGCHSHNLKQNTTVQILNACFCLLIVFFQELQVQNAQEQRGHRPHRHVETRHQEQLHNGVNLRRLHTGYLHAQSSKQFVKMYYYTIVQCIIYTQLQFLNVLIRFYFCILMQFCNFYQFFYFLFLYSFIFISDLGILIFQL